MREASDTFAPMKEHKSVTLPLRSLLLVGTVAVVCVVGWRLLVPRPHVTDNYQPATEQEPENPAPKPTLPPAPVGREPIPQDLLPPLPGRALPQLRSITDMFAQAGPAKARLTSSTLRRGNKSRFEIILQPDWAECASPDFDISFTFADEVLLGVRSAPIPPGNTPALAHAGHTLDSILSGYKDLRLRVQDTLEIAGETWSVFELGSPQASHLGLFTYAGPKGCFVIAVAARNRSFELRRNEWTRVVQSFRFPPRN